MDVTPLIRKGQNIIQSYKNGAFKISGKNYDTAVIVTPEECRSWDVSKEFSALGIKDFKKITEKAAEFDVCLMGTGEIIQFLPKELKSELKKEGIHIEVMDTGAACRTYNVLMAEGRRVVALLLPT